MSMLTILNPATGTVIREMLSSSTADVSDAVSRARAAQTTWSSTPMAQRIAILRRFRDALVERQDQSAMTLSAETGKPISQARGEIGATPGRIDFFGKR